ncbi:MAG: arylsulfotransferase family protein [Solirubrobacteraceae bacterium]
MNKFKRLAAPVSLALAAALIPAARAARVSISPLPGTPTALPHTQISFLGASASSLSSISVIGSRSGRHSGHLRAYASATGSSFLPNKPFLANEHVTVQAQWHTAGTTVPLSTHFKIAQPVAVALTRLPTTPGTPEQVQSFHSQPTLHPPAVLVDQATSSASAPAAGYIFATPSLGPGQYGPMIFDSAGNLVWFRALPAGQNAADLHTQVFEGKNDITWWQGRTGALGYGLGEDVIADANYKTVAVVRAGNGLQADEHELDLTPQGAAYVLAYSPVKANLSSAGGPARGVAVEGVVQEIDIHTGLVMWEWHSLDHIGVAQSYSKPGPAPSTPFDYFHIDSLATDSHGNLLISARNTWTIYDISGQTGAVRWRLGGKGGTFKLGPGVAFAYQHNAAWLPNGDISVFDDEGLPAVNPPSRGEVIALDPKAKTASLVTQLIRTAGPLTAGSQGDVQSLPDGGWMVGWGDLPNLTEFDAQGHVVYDAQLPAGESSYRVYREPWAAQPSEPPALSATTAAGETTAYASWNGATTVTSWQLLSGSTATALTPVATVPRSGFETTIPAPAATFVEARALSASGRVIGTSKVIAPASG